MARFEWIIVELLVIGLLVYELVSIRRTLKRDREAAAANTLSGDAPMSDAADHMRQGQHEDRHQP